MVSANLQGVSVILDYGCIVTMPFWKGLGNLELCDSWRKILTWLSSGNKSLVETVLPLKSEKHPAGGVTQRGRKFVQALFSKAEVLYLSPFWNYTGATHSPASRFEWDAETLFGPIDSSNDRNYIFTSVALCVVPVSRTVLEFCSLTFLTGRINPWLSVMREISSSSFSQMKQIRRRSLKMVT